MGKSLRVPVLCPCRVPGLETRILGPCRLSAWGRNRQERAGMGRNGQEQAEMGSCRAAGVAGEKSAVGRMHPYRGSWGGRRYLGWFLWQEAHRALGWA